MAVARSCPDCPGRGSKWSAFFRGLLGIIALCAAAAAQDLPAKIISLNQQLRGQASPAAVTKILQQRRVAVEQLMRDSPAWVRSVMLKPGETAQLAAVSPEAASLVEKEGEWSGPLEMLAEDDFDHHRSITHWRVRTAKGPVELFFAHGAPAAKATCSPKITVAGVGTEKAVAVDSVVALSNSPPACSTKGVQRVAVILLTMPSATTFPSGFDSNYFQQLFFSNSGYSLNTYWDESSYGQTSATGQVFGPFALTADYSCTDNDSLANAAIMAASTVDFTQFDRVALVFPVQTCSYGGLGTIGCWETIVPSQNISVAWLPVFPYQQTSNYVGTVTHELGHNLGLNHANTLDHDTYAVGAFDDVGSNTEYGDPFSVMGQVWTSDGQQKIFGQYDAPHKSLDLDWLDLSDGDFQEVVASGSFTLMPFESSSGLRALRVLRDPALGGWMWLEYRQPLGQVDSTFNFLTDVNEPTSIFDGALVHLENAGLDPLHSYLVDFSAVAQPNDFYNAPLLSGQTWSDPYSPLTLSIGGADSSGMSATVTYDQTCAVLGLTGTPIASGGGGGSISVTAPSNCSWAATTRTGWITLTGATSGAGNGTVNFTAPASPGGTLQRDGYITIERQSIKVTQAGTGPLVVGATPALGTGLDAHMTFTFRNPRGQANISSATINISDLANPSVDACSLFIDHASSTISLLNDSGTQYLTPLNFADEGNSVANSQCEVAATGSSITGSGNVLQIALQITFDADFVGAHNVVATVADTTTGVSNPIQVATWMVPVIGSGPVMALLDPSALDFGNRPVGSPSLPSPVTLTNSGAGILQISSIWIDGTTDFTQTNNCGSSLAPGSSCTVQVTYTPSATGISESSLLVVDSAVGSPQSVALSGSGGMIPVATVNPASVIFGSQDIGTRSSPSTITFSNTGSDVMSIVDIAIVGNNADDFSQTNNCGSSLAAGSSCNISVVFKPTDGGSRLGAILISDSASGSPRSISLSGTASDFQIGSSEGNPAATVSAGQTATYHLQLNPENGFTGNVTIACSDSVPLSSCTAQTGSIAVAG
ncbi:MAG TPA: choice-of-anchor D domain-containing protein, partial [Terriglobales bacterium]|nr:choice-of-anchor D domain-containing protein [Terriglobales bacterium]